MKMEWKMKKKKASCVRLLLKYFNENFNEKSKTSMKTKQKRNINEKEMKIEKVA